MRIGPQLRGLVQNAHDVVQVQRLFFDHRGHHDARRGTADGTGELGFHELHQTRIGRDVLHARRAHLLGVLFKRPLSRALAQKARRQRQQITDLCAALPEHGARPRVAVEDIHEQQRLAGLHRRGRAPQGHAHVGQDVEHQAPDHGVREVVQAREPQKSLGLEPCQAKGAVLQKTHREPTRLGQRRQHQGVDPKRKPHQQAGQGTALCATFPIHAAEHGGSELRHGRETDQADADQGIGLARQIKIHIAEQHDAQNGRAPNAQQQRAEVAAGARTKALGAQQPRHDQVVADHGGDSDGLHNHHACGRRQAPDEGQQGQGGVALGQRQRQHKGLGVHVARAKDHQAPQRNGQDEQVDQKQIQREHPHRSLEVALIDVLHHHHLELTRQKNHRQHGQHNQ